MILFEIPGNPIEIEHLVLDYNGTIALDGQLLPEVGDILRSLPPLVTVHVITADTHGTARAALEGICHVHLLTSADQRAEKAAYVLALGASRVMAVGNGRNDEAMLAVAALGIAVCQRELASTATLLASTMFATDIRDVLNLFRRPARAVATHRV